MSASGKWRDMLVERGLHSVILARRHRVQFGGRCAGAQVARDGAGQVLHDHLRTGWISKHEVRI